MTTKEKPQIKKEEVPASDNGNITPEQARQFLARQQQEKLEACQAELAEVYRKHNCIPATIAISPSNRSVPIKEMLLAGWSTQIVLEFNG